MNSYRTENYIRDKVIIITGASSGFGKETAKKAAELGGRSFWPRGVRNCSGKLRRRSVKAAARLPTSRPMFV